MTQSPWQQPVAEPPSPEGRAVSGAIVVVAVVVAALASGAVAWWLQDSRVRLKEQERVAAVTELAGLVSRVQAAESGAANAAQLVKQAQAAAESSAKQTTALTTELDAARRDAATIRTERDEARTALAASRGDADRSRNVDLDPASLPQVELPKVFQGITKFRTAVDLLVVGPAVGGLGKDEVDAMLGEALQQRGFEATAQSPFRLALFVSLGKDQPRRALGVMMLALRSMKVPGEVGSREVAVWGQQRTSTVSDAEATGQLRALVEELAGELARGAGVKPEAAAATPPSTLPAPKPVPSAPASPVGTP